MTLRTGFGAASRIADGFKPGIAYGAFVYKEGF